MKEQGYELVNADCTIIAQKPKMAPYIEQMKEKIASLLEAAVRTILMLKQQPQKNSGLLDAEKELPHK